MYVCVCVDNYVINSKVNIVFKKKKNLQVSLRHTKTLKLNFFLKKKKIKFR